MLRSIILIFLFTIPMAVLSNEISIEMIGKVDKKSIFEDDLCDLEYKITNNSTGTIYKISLGIDGWDDRGSKFDELLSFSVDNNDGSFGYKKVGKGESASFTGGSFKGTCKYLKTLKVENIKPQNCVIRMLPENIDCNDIITLLPGSTELKID